MEHPLIKFFSLNSLKKDIFSSLIRRYSSLTGHQNDIQV